MKFSSTLVTLGLAVGSVVAEPIARRDLETFEGIISDISAGVDALDTAVQGFNGGDGAEVESASQDLIETINAGVETANGQEQLSTQDAFALVQPVRDLADKVNTLVDNVIDKKPAVVEAGLGGTMLENLNQQYDAAQSLSEAISSKVPENMSDIAAELSSAITDAIQRGIDEYQGAGDGDDGDDGDDGGDKPTTTGGGSEPTKTGGDDGGEEPTKTGGGSEPTSSPSGTGGMPMPPNPTGGSPTATTPPYTGAAVANKYNGAGALVAAAAILAF